MNPDDGYYAPPEVRLCFALAILLPFAAAHLFIPFELDLASPLTLGLVFGVLLSVPPIAELLLFHLRWHAEPLRDGRVTLRRMHQTLTIEAADFVTLEYGLLGARAVFADGQKLLLADDASAALLLGTALLLDQFRKPGGPYRAK